MRPVEIQGLVFRSDGLVEISYAEKHEQCESAGIMRTVLLERILFAEDLEDLEAEIADLIEDVLEHIKHPEDRVKKLQRLLEPPEEEDDDD